MTKKKQTDEADSNTTRFPKKYEKLLPKEPSYQDEVEQLTTDQLKEKLVECHQMISQTEKQEENDTELNDLKEQVKEQKAVYKDITNICDAKSRYIVYVLENRGVV